MKPRDLLPIIERVRRSTTNGDIVTICDALFKRVQHEVATQAKPKSADDVVMRELAKFVEIDPPLPSELAAGLVIRRNGKRVDPRDVLLDAGVTVVTVPQSDEYLAGIMNRDMPRTAMDAVVEHAEGGRKPATGKAKRAIAKLAARKAARKGSR